MEDSTAPAEVTDMSSNSIKVNGVEVKCDISKPTVININFSQPVAPSCFQDFCTSVGKALKPQGNGAGCRWGPAPMPTVNTIAEVKVALQASRIVLGLISISLGVLLNVVHQSDSYERGVAFWTGIPFILSGMLSLAKEKTTLRFWVCAASLMNLASLVTSIIGTVVIANDLRWRHDYYWNSNYLCEQRRNFYNGGYGGGYRASSPPYEDYHRKAQCEDFVQRVLGLFHGVRVLLLLVTVFVLVVNLCSGLCDLVSRWCTASPSQSEADATNYSFQSLDPSQLPPAYEEKKKELQTI